MFHCINIFIDTSANNSLNKDADELTANFLKAISEDERCLRIITGLVNFVEVKVDQLISSIEDKFMHSRYNIINYYDSHFEILKKSLNSCKIFLFVKILKLSLKMLTQL